jgi:integrase
MADNPRGPIPSPWLRKSTGTYYVTIDGKQINLGKDKRKAHEEFRRIMNTRGRGESQSLKISVRELADLWTANCKRSLSHETYKTYKHVIESFCEKAGGLPMRNLRPFHVTNWIADNEWAQSTVHLRISVVKAMTAWGEEQGYLDSDPITKLKRPEITRRDPIAMEDAIMIMGAVRPSLAVALKALLFTGLRPGELCSMVAEKIDLKARKATVKGKTGVRTVPLSELAIQVLEPLVAKHPSGPIFIGGRGSPLTVHGMDTSIIRARRKAAKERKLDENAFDYITPHCFRGLFSTEAIRNGVDTGLVSKLLGHKDPSILLKHYAAPDDAMMLDAADRATRIVDKKPDTPQEPLE